MKKEASETSQELAGKLALKLNRTIVREHIPKKMGNLEEPITTEKVFDNTYDRINGAKREEMMVSENRGYGTSKNPADLMPK